MTARPVAPAHGPSAGKDADDAEVDGRIDALEAEPRTDGQAVLRGEGRR